MNKTLGALILCGYSLVSPISQSPLYADDFQDELASVKSEPIKSSWLSWFKPARKPAPKVHIAQKPNYLKLQEEFYKASEEGLVNPKSIFASDKGRFVRELKIRSQYLPLPQVDWQEQVTDFSQVESVVRQLYGEFTGRDLGDRVKFHILPEDAFQRLRAEKQVGYCRNLIIHDINTKTGWTSEVYCQEAPLEAIVRAIGHELIGHDTSAHYDPTVSEAIATAAYYSVWERLNIDPSFRGAYHDPIKVRKDRSFELYKDLYDTVRSEYPVNLSRRDQIEINIKVRNCLNNSQAPYK